MLLSPLASLAVMTVYNDALAAAHDDVTRIRGRFRRRFAVAVSLALALPFGLAAACIGFLLDVPLVWAALGVLASLAVAFSLTIGSVRTASFVRPGFAWWLPDPPTVGQPGR